MRSKDSKRIFLVTGKSSFSMSGAETWLQDLLSECSVVRFSDFSENPTVSEVEYGLSVYRKKPPDLILAVGGGSAIDIAKAIGFFGASGLDPTEYLKNGGAAEFKMPMLLALPTTAGTGSEATHFAVLYLDKKKYSLAEPVLFPAHVILIPQFTASMSAYLTACTGLDALAQAIEAHWAVSGNEESRAYAEKAIRLALCHLENAVEQPDEKSRAGMVEAAYWAGRAINISKTTLCHALSYYMTAHYAYPHGHAVALFLPAVFAAHEQHQVLDRSLIQLFPSSPAPFLKKISSRLGLAARHSFSNKELMTIASKVEPERMKNNPVGFDESELVDLVTTALTRME